MRRTHELAVKKEVDGPRFQRALGAVGRVVVIGIVPGVATQHARIGHCADVNVDGRFSGLLRVVPVDACRVGDGRALDQRRVDIGQEAQRDEFARLERAVIGEVIGGNDLPCHADARGQAIEGRRLVDVGNVIRRDFVEIVPQEHVQRWNVTDVLHGHRVLERRARNGGTATEHGHIFHDRQHLGIAHDHDGRFGTGGRVTVAVG